MLALVQLLLTSWVSGSTSLVSLRVYSHCNPDLMLLVCCLEGPAKVAHGSGLLLQLVLVSVCSPLMLLHEMLQMSGGRQGGGTGGQGF